MPGFGLGGSPALESNLWLSETAEPERSQKDLEGLGGPDNLVCQDETERYVVWSTRAHTQSVHHNWPLLGNPHGNLLAGYLILKITGQGTCCCRTSKTPWINKICRCPRLTIQCLSLALNSC